MIDKNTKANKKIRNKLKYNFKKQKKIVFLTF